MTTEKIKDGCPAFPEKRATKMMMTGSDLQPQPIFETVGGMSLRDWFAGQALAGVAANPNTPDQLIGFGFEGAKAILADYAYAAADAMLKAREAQS